MMKTIALKCQCGKVKGSADISAGNRLICYCDDCQALACFLEKQNELLDQSHGTDIFQLSPSQIKIDLGSEQFRCVDLKGKGVLRWYTDCCKTPIGNTLSTSQIPFIGMPHLFMDHAGDGKTRGEALGEIELGVHGRFAKGECFKKTHEKVPAFFIFKTLLTLMMRRLRKLDRPNPFFDEEGQPLAKPRILSSEERQKLYS